MLRQKIDVVMYKFLKYFGHYDQGMERMIYFEGIYRQKKGERKSEKGIETKTEISNEKGLSERMK